jgi:hypothetical protein
MSEIQNTSVRLYSPTLITVATLLGAPVAGCILLAHNFRVLGRHSAARQWLVGGSVGTAVLLVVGYFLPDNFPNMVLPISYTMGMHQAVKQLQGAEYASHLARGGAKGSAWMAVGTGLACLCAIVGIVLLVALVLPE